MIDDRVYNVLKIHPSLQRMTEIHFSPIPSSKVLLQTAVIIWKTDYNVRLAVEL